MSANDVALAFVNHYYTSLNSNPAALGSLYVRLILKSRLNHCIAVLIVFFCLVLIATSPSSCTLQMASSATAFHSYMGRQHCSGPSGYHGKAVVLRQADAQHPRAADRRAGEPDRVCDADLRHRPAHDREQPPNQLLTAVPACRHGTRCLLRP